MSHSTVLFGKMAKYTSTVASRKALRQLLINAGGDAELWALTKPKE